MSEEQDGFMLNAFGVDLGQAAQDAPEEGGALPVPEAASLEPNQLPSEQSGAGGGGGVTGNSEGAPFSQSGQPPEQPSDGDSGGGPTATGADDSDIPEGAPPESEQPPELRIPEDPSLEPSQLPAEQSGNDGGDGLTGNSEGAPFSQSDPPNEQPSDEDSGGGPTATGGDDSDNPEAPPPEPEQPPELRIPEDPSLEPSQLPAEQSGDDGGGGVTGSSDEAPFSQSGQPPDQPSATERAMAGASGASAAAPAPEQPPKDDDSGSFFDQAVEGVKDLGGKIVKEGEEDFDAAKALAGQVVEGAKKALGDPNAESGGQPSVPQADGGLPKTLKDALAGFAPIIDVPGLGRFDVAASLTKAANQVVARNTPGRLPFLEVADELLDNASLILDENRNPSVGAIPLPRPTVPFSGQCCSIDELQKFRGAIEPLRNSLRGFLNAYRDSQQAIEDAAQQGKTICYGAAVGALFATASPIGPGAGGVAACFAACVACIGAASPVQNAVRVQIKAKEDVEIANSALGRALANHQNCFVNLCPSPATPSPKTPPEPVDLGDVDDPPARDLGDVDDPPARDLGDVDEKK